MLFNIKHFSKRQRIVITGSILVYYYVLYSDYAKFRELWCAIVCNRLFLVWLDPSVECRHVRRNTIPWTFLAYIATHYVIESERLTLASRGQYWTIDCRPTYITSDSVGCKSPVAYIVISTCKSYKNANFHVSVKK